MYCTIVHSKTFNIQALVKEADIVVAAVGSANLVKGSWIKKGAVLIDVGINRLKVENKNILVGDINFNEVKDIASYITPVPGGVGPMTIACLLLNTLLTSYEQFNENPIELSSFLE